jgi:hypothetical protein
MKAASSKRFGALEGLSDERTVASEVAEWQRLYLFDTVNQAGGVTLLVRATPTANKT